MVFERISAKIQSLSKALGTVQHWKQMGDRVVWTNGVFDLLHPGHIRYLCAARDLGDHLVIGINSDESVRRLKGPDRPVNPEESRLLQIASMEMVDLLVLFEEDTPLTCILQLQPHIICKGGDYQVEDVVGGSEARNWGGIVKILPFEEGYSSTGIIGKIKNMES